MTFVLNHVKHICPNTMHFRSQACLSTLVWRIFLRFSSCQDIVISFSLSILLFSHTCCDPFIHCIPCTKLVITKMNFELGSLSLPFFFFFLIIRFSLPASVSGDIFHLDHDYFLWKAFVTFINLLCRNEAKDVFCRKVSIIAIGVKNWNTLIVIAYPLLFHIMH